MKNFLLLKNHLVQLHQKHKMLLQVIKQQILVNQNKEVRFILFPVIISGKIEEENIKILNLSKDFIEKKLRNKDIKILRIFIMQIMNMEDYLSRRLVIFNIFEYNIKRVDKMIVLSR